MNRSSPIHRIGQGSVLFLLFLILPACKVSWNSVIKRGSVDREPFTETVSAVLEHNLMIVPVVIEGTTYRFLFDTGAITAISKELQANMEYKVVTTGTIKDSQGQRQQMQYVRVPEMQIGGVSFFEQGAFVADLRANPILRCMNLDGIVGSNTMRLCNWTLDYQSPRVSFTNQPLPEPAEGVQVASFRPNGQYAMKMDLKVGSATITNLTFDTGSTNGISVPKKIFVTLRDRAILDSIYHQTGYSQSGLMGNVVPLNRSFSYVDSLQWGSMVQDDLKMVVSHSGLVGNLLWSRYITTIDWDRQQVFLAPVAHAERQHHTYGFSIGENQEGKVFIRATVTDGVAEQAGIEALSEVLAIGPIDFERGHSLCDFLAVRDSLYQLPQLRLITQNKEGEQVSVILPRIALE